MESKLEQYIESNFQTAIESGYIQPFYQPVIRTISRKLCSFEALARWVDPDFGVIRPNQFIPILEKKR
jgi:EAL domain-containing protein (putative c-di-GMP-specific phosphodiesterase class I)